MRYLGIFEIVMMMTVCAVNVQRSVAHGQCTTVRFMLRSIDSRAGSTLRSNRTDLLIHQSIQRWICSSSSRPSSRVYLFIARVLAITWSICRAQLQELSQAVLKIIFWLCETIRPGWFVLRIWLLSLIDLTYRSFFISKRGLIFMISLSRSKN